jgi:hypothetical protein
MLPVTMVDNETVTLIPVTDVPENSRLSLPDDVMVD